MIFCRLAVFYPESNLTQTYFFICVYGVKKVKLEPQIRSIKMIVLHTSLGDIKLNLFNDKAPVTCENFLSYVKDGHYNGTIFHRVIKNFMIQGGGMDANLKAKKTKAPIKNEANNGLKNTKYTIAMARTSDPHSATSQFFINTVDNDYLNFTAENESGWGYCVFGEVVDGKDVVDTIGKVKTGSVGFYRDVPKETVTITSAEVVD